MDRGQVRAALRAAGLPDESFQFPGVHESTPTPTDFWFLRPAGCGWEIGAYERGRYTVRERFATEAAACARLYTVLTGSPAGDG